MDAKKKSRATGENGDGIEDRTPAEAGVTDDRSAALTLVNSVPIEVSGALYPAGVGKRYDLKDGELVSSFQDRGPECRALHHRFDSFADYLAAREDMDACTMLFCGTWGEDVTGAAIITKKAAAIREQRGTVGESLVADKQHLAFRDPPSILRIDVDFKTDNDVAALNLADSPQWTTPDEVLDALESIAPELKGVPRAARESTSSMIYGPKGEQLRGPGGFRVDILVESGASIPHNLEVLHQRLLVEGMGWAFVDEAGRIHVRTAVDQALKVPTQPDFAAPILGKGLEQRRVTVSRDADGALGLGFLPSLPSDATGELKRAEAALVAPLKAQASSIRDARLSAVREDLVARHPGMRPAKARLIARRMFGATAELGPELQIVLENGDTLSVERLLQDGSALDGELLPDPVEPGYGGGRALAKFFWNEGVRPGIFTFAHGGRWLRLVSSPALVETAPDIETVVRMMALAPSGADEKAEFHAAARKVGSRLKVPVSVLHEQADAILQESARMSLEAAGEDDAGSEVSRYADGLVPLDVPIPMPFVHHTKSGDARPMPHIENVDEIMRRYGFHAAFNVLRKEVRWSFRGGKPESHWETLESLITSQAALCKVPVDRINQHLAAIMRRNSENPVLEWIESLEWDGTKRTHRLPELFGVTSEEEPLPPELASMLRRWMIQMVALMDRAKRTPHPTARAKGETCLVLVGAQGANKTKAISSLLPKHLQDYISTGVVTDLGSRDGAWGAVRGAITEFGEIDGLFRRTDVAAMKAFLSKEQDSMRLPWGRTFEDFPRMTSFCASVNSMDFLTDATGSRRFLPVTVVAEPGFPTLPEDELSQIWAEIWDFYLTGEQWWATEEEARFVELLNRGHRAPSAAQEWVHRIFDFSRADEVTRHRIGLVEFEGKVRMRSHFGTPLRITPMQFSEAMREAWYATGKVRPGEKVHALDRSGVREWVPLHSPGGGNYGFLHPPLREHEDLTAEEFETEPAPADGKPKNKLRLLKT